MIDDGSENLGMLVQYALKDFPLDAIYKFATDRDPVVRTKAAQRLQLDKESSPRTFDFAVELANSKRVYEREIAAFLLGQLVPPDHPYKKQSVPVLVRLARDPSPTVSESALYALGHLRTRKAEDLALASVADKNACVVASAAFGLWSLGLHKTHERRVRAAMKRFSEKQRMEIEKWLED